MKKEHARGRKSIIRGRVENGEVREEGRYINQKGKDAQTVKKTILESC